jgi:hypothetical protein
VLIPQDCLQICPELLLRVLQCRDHVHKHGISGISKQMRSIAGDVGQRHGGVLVRPVRLQDCLYPEPTVT